MLDSIHVKFAYLKYINSKINFDSQIGLYFLNDLISLVITIHLYTGTLPHIGVLYI